MANTRYGNLHLTDLESERQYSVTKAYGNAKLAQILHAKELNRRYGAQGLTAVSLHPGNIASNFSSEADTPWRRIYTTPLRSNTKGADTLI